MKILSEVVAKRIRAGKPVTLNHDPYLIAYWTRGGTYVIGTNGNQTDSGRPHDLMAIGFSGEVIVLRPTANPDLVDDVKEAMA